MTDDEIDLLVQRFHDGELTVIQIMKDYGVNFMDIWLSFWRHEHPGEPVPEERRQKADYLKKWIAWIRETNPSPG